MRSTRGAGRRRTSRRLPAVLILTSALVVAACSSGGTGGKGTTAAPASSAVLASPGPVTTAPSTPAPSASPQIGYPTPTSTATSSHVTRPPGAKPLDFADCTKANNGFLSMQRDLGGMLSAYATVPDVVKANLAHEPPFIKTARAEMVTGRAIWVRAGYPENFPIFRDIDNLIAATDRFAAAARTGDVAALPAIYLALNSAGIQMNNDASEAVCPG